MKIGRAYFYKGYQICPNYGGWVIIYDYNAWDFNIYKTLKDAQEAEKKRKDGSNRTEPRIIGRMTAEQFINAMVI